MAGMTVQFGSGSELRVVLQADAPRRMFFNCSRCKAVVVRDYQAYQTVVPGRPQTLRPNCWGRVANGWWYALGETQQCACGKELYGQELNATVNPDHICNDKCVSATRNVCECSCGGVNHGGRHVA